MVFSSSSLDCHTGSHKRNGRALPGNRMPASRLARKRAGPRKRHLRNETTLCRKRKPHSPITKEELDRAPSRLPDTRVRASVRGSPSCHTRHRNDHTVSRRFCPKRQADSTGRLIPHARRSVNKLLRLCRNVCLRGANHGRAGALQCGFQVASLARVPLSSAATEDESIERNQSRQLGASGNGGTHRHRARP
jgi:hypothetical protein